MENASKALIMASGILIGVLIISLAVYLFADFGATSAEITRQVEEQKIVQFNSRFTSYLNKELTIYDIITILGYVQENNTYYADSLSDQITVFIELNNITNNNETSKKELITNDQLRINSSGGELPKYELRDENIRYNANTNKVNYMKFTTI